MKALLILALFVVASNIEVSEAGFGTFLKETFSKIGSVFKTTGQQLLGTLDNIGGTLFDKFKAAGKNLLSQGVQALALNTMNSIKENKAATKREMSSLMTGLKEFETKAHNVLDVAVDHLKPLLHSAVSAFNTLIEHVKEFRLDSKTIVETVDRITGLHSHYADEIMKAVISRINEFAAQLTSSHKRSIFDGLQGIISQLTESLKPAIEGVKTMVNTTGTLLKNAASGLLTNVQQHFGELLGSLTTQGANALQSLVGTAQQ